MKLKMVVEDEKYKPTYANDTDACMDLKVKIDEDNENNDERVAFIMPNETKVFGTGVKVSIPLEHVMLIFPRSSTGIKLHCMLSNTTGVIRDEIRMAVTNFGNETVCLQDGQRLAQFMIIPRPKLELEFVEDNEDFRQNDRGGGIGSSGEM